MRLNPDAPVYRAWAAAADLVLVNMLTLVACAPVVTAGASLVACTRSVMGMARDEGGSVARNWWRTFRSCTPNLALNPCVRKAKGWRESGSRFPFRQSLLSKWQLVAPRDTPYA